jgi:hypothetical protein
MNSIDFESLLVIIFVLVDDWYQSKEKSWSGKSPGAKPEMSDSEIITLALIMDYLPFPGESQFLGFIRANYRQWFPTLLERSQFNRRLRRLEHKMEILRRTWVEQLGGFDADSFVIDTKPIPVVSYRRGKRHSDFDGSADYGYCAARKMSARHAASQAACAIALLKYFGYKLVVLSTLKGLPIAYDLVSANTDERLAVEEVLQVVHEIQNTGRNPERLLNKTVGGLATHMAAKIASHTLPLLLRGRFGIDVLTLFLSKNYIFPSTSSQIFDYLFRSFCCFGFLHRIANNVLNLLFG